MMAKRKEKPEQKTPQEGKVVTLETTPSKEDSNQQPIKRNQGGLDEEKTKHLLKEFELSGLDRESFDLLAHCNDRTSYYGKKGSDLRRQTSRRWTKIKEKDINKYIECLENFGLTPSVATLVELSLSDRKTQPAKMTKKKVFSDDSSSSGSSCSSVRSSTNSTISSDRSRRTGSKSKCSSSSRASKKLQKKLAKQQKEKPVHRTPSRTPSRTSSLSPYYQKGLFSPPIEGLEGLSLDPMHGPSEINLRPSKDFLIPTRGNCWGLLFVSEQKGTKTNPNLLGVDLERPEHNREFDISLVDGMVRNSFERKGLHIRAAVHPFDHGHFSATIPRAENFPPQFARRLILIKGPTNPMWLTRTAEYNEDIGCSATLATHQAHDKDRTKSEPREFQYWLAVCPPEIQLDNQIFSCHETHVKKTNNPMILGKNAKNNKANKELEGMAIYFEIALQGGREIGEMEEDEEYVEMFERKKKNAKSNKK